MQIWPAVALVCTIVIQLIVAVYVYGKLTERVSNHGKTLDRHELTLSDHDKRLRLVETGEALSQIAEWVREVHGRQ